MSKTKRLVVELPKVVFERFERNIERLGFTKKSAIEKMVNDFCLCAEEVPTFFEWMKTRPKLKREGKTR